MEPKQQLQEQIQTIQVLDAEKTELQSALSQSQQAAMDTVLKAAEIQGNNNLRKKKNSHHEIKLKVSNRPYPLQEKFKCEHQRNYKAQEGELQL